MSKLFCKFFVCLSFFFITLQSSFSAPSFRVFLNFNNKVEQLGFLIAQQKKFYSPQLNVQFVESAETEPLNALEYGLADIVQESFNTALERNERTQSYTLVAQLYQMPTLVLACAKPSVSNLQQLSGKIIGYEKNSVLNAAQIWLGYLGFDFLSPQTPYKFEQLSDLTEGFSRGRLTCGLMEKHLVPLVTSRTTSQFSYFSPKFEEGGILAAGFYVLEKSYESADFKLRLKDFLKGSAEGWQYVFDHKEEVLDQILTEKDKEKFPFEVALRMLSLLSENYDFKDKEHFAAINDSKIEYSLKNLLMVPQYSKITDRPKNDFFKDPSEK